MSTQNRFEYKIEARATTNILINKHLNQREYQQDNDKMVYETEGTWNDKMRMFELKTYQIGMKQFKSYDFIVKVS